MRGPAIVAALCLLAGPVHADPDAPDRGALCWRYDAGFGVVIPIWRQDYEDATSFGGRLLFRATRGWIATQVDVGVLSRDHGPAPQQLGYRARGLAGVRFRREPEDRRAYELRLLGGLDLAGVDSVHTDWLAEEYEPGAAAEVSIENRSYLGWGTVAIHGAIGMSYQPSRWVGVELMFALVVSM